MLWCFIQTCRHLCIFKLLLIRSMCTLRSSFQMIWGTRNAPYATLSTESYLTHAQTSGMRRRCNVRPGHCRPDENKLHHWRWCRECTCLSGEFWQQSIWDWIEPEWKGVQALDASNPQMWVSRRGNAMRTCWTEDGKYSSFCVRKEQARDQIQIQSLRH